MTYLKKKYSKILEGEGKLVKIAFNGFSFFMALTLFLFFLIVFLGIVLPDVSTEIFLTPIVICISLGLFFGISFIVIVGVDRCLRVYRMLDKTIALFIPNVKFKVKVRL